MDHNSEISREVAGIAIARLFIAISAATALLVGLAAYAYIGFFSRYWTDDYCFAGTLAKEGFIGAQRWWYLNWHGRFGTSLLQTLTSIAGHSIVPLLPAVTMLVWLGTLYWTCRRLMITVGVDGSRLEALLLAELILYTYLRSAGSLAQTLYWQSVLLAYTTPLILLTVYLGLVLTPQLTRTKILFGAGLTFLAGGFNETYMLFQIGLLGAAAVGYFVVGTSRARNTIYPLLGSGLAGAIIAAGIMSASPGNAVRTSMRIASGLAVHPPLFDLIRWAVIEAIRFLIRPVSPSTLVMVVMLVGILTGISECKGSRTPRVRTLTRPLLVSIMMGFLLIILGNLPSIYMGMAPPSRTLVNATCIVIGIAVLGGYTVGIGIRHIIEGRCNSWTRRIVHACGIIGVAAALILDPLSTAYRLVGTSSVNAAYVRQWDARHRFIREEAKRSQVIVVHQLDAHPAWVQDLTEDKMYWANKCIADYYGIESISTALSDSVGRRSE